MDVELMEVAKQGAVRVGTDFTDPEDDWLPVMFFRTRKGEVKIVMLSNPGGGILASQISGVLRMHGCTEAVFMAAAWMVEADTEEEKKALEGVTLSTHPHRKEALTLLHVGLDFCVAERASVYLDDNDIRRLGEWGDRSEGMDVGGEIADVMRAGIADV